MAAAPRVKKKPEREPQAQDLGTPIMDSETPRPIPAVTPDGSLADSIQDLALDHLTSSLGLLAKILGTVEAVGSGPSAPTPAQGVTARPPAPEALGCDDLDGAEEGQDEERAP
jgi:hypothetical protein